jgi:pyridoxamine 5'-phosphate oxidase
VIPERIEFWQAEEYRLHNRLVYSRSGDGWKTETLYP